VFDYAQENSCTAREYGDVLLPISLFPHQRNWYKKYIYAELSNTLLLEKFVLKLLRIHFLGGHNLSHGALAKIGVALAKAGVAIVRPGKYSTCVGFGRAGVGRDGSTLSKEL
jgi:hypothetical protein